MQEGNKDKKASPLYSEFAYDDAYRTMETECDDIVIPFVNYFYNENYDNTAKITRLRNEHFVEHADQSDEKRITDSHFEITQDDVSKNYHLECESRPYDQSILVRIFEYDTQTALDKSKSEGNVLRVRFPYTGLILLRTSSTSPDRAEIIIETPNGEVNYDVKIIKVSDFSIDNIFENRLYMMIPFYIFNFESEFKAINEDADRTEKLADVFRDIIDRLDRELEKGNLSALSHNVIIRLTHKVVYKLTMKHDKVQDKVGGIMGGKVLDLPEIRIFHEGKAEGLKEGEAERKKLYDENAELEEEISSLKAELEKLRKQIKK